MARIDRIFSRLQIGTKSNLPQFYLAHLHETKDSFEGTPHIWWTHMTTEHGFPGHKSKAQNRVFPLSGFLVYRNDNFSLAGDEVLISACGIRSCCQTHHFRVLKKADKY